MSEDKKENLVPIYALLFGVYAILILFGLQLAPVLNSLVGVALIVLMVFGSIVGLIIGFLWFNLPFRVKMLNSMFKTRNYHIIKIMQSGDRIKTFVVEVGVNPTINLSGRAFTIDSKYLKMEDGVPTLYYPENDTLPLAFGLDNVKEKVRDPSLINTAILKHAELARLNAMNFSKFIKLMLMVIVGVAAIGALFSLLSYFKVDDFLKVAQASAAQAIENAKTLVK